jgi:hypothetical protein
LINAPGKVVTLRGLNVAGRSCTLNGVLIQDAAAVFIEDCVIESWPQKGILDAHDRADQARHQEYDRPQ